MFPNDFLLQIDRTHSGLRSFERVRSGVLEISRKEKRYISLPEKTGFQLLCPHESNRYYVGEDGGLYKPAETAVDIRVATYSAALRAQFPDLKIEELVGSFDAEADVIYYGEFNGDLSGSELEAEESRLMADVEKFIQAHFAKQGCVYAPEEGYYLTPVNPVHVAVRVNREGYRPRSALVYLQEAFDFPNEVPSYACFSVEEYLRRGARELALEVAFRHHQIMGFARFNRLEEPEDFTVESKIDDAVACGLSSEFCRFDRSEHPAYAAEALMWRVGDCLTDVTELLEGVANGKLDSKAQHNAMTLLRLRSEVLSTDVLSSEVVRERLLKDLGFAR